MKKYRLNILSFVSVLLNFILNVFLVRQFKLSRDLDLYFATGTLIMYFGHIIQIFYESFPAYYASLFQGDRGEAHRFYSALINQSSLAAIGIIILLQIIGGVIAKFFLKSQVATAFFRVSTLSLIFQNIDIINRSILNINFRFTVNYLTNILYSLINLALIYILKPYCGIMALAYASIVSYLVTVLLEAIYIRRNLGIRYYPIISHERTMDVLKGSLYIKGGSLLYNIKDVLTSKLLLGMEPGANSIFTYGSKFANSLYSIIYGPALSIHKSKAIHDITRGKWGDIPKYTMNTIKQPLKLFIPSVIIGFFALPQFLKIIMGIEFHTALGMRNTFLLLSLFYLAYGANTCYGQIINAYKRFDIILLGNFGFFLGFIISLLIMKGSLIGIIAAMFLAELVSLCIYYIHATRLLKKDLVGKEERPKVPVVGFVSDESVIWGLVWMLIAFELVHFLFEDENENLKGSISALEGDIIKIMALVYLISSIRIHTPGEPEAPPGRKPPTGPTKKSKALRSWLGGHGPKNSP